MVADSASRQLLCGLALKTVAEACEVHTARSLPGDDYRGFREKQAFRSKNWGGGGGGGGGDGGGCHTQGFSGRILRKLPFLAHTHLMQPRCSCEEYINALQQACNVERTDRDVLAG
eukprot:1182606-Prorocentrum_minimum.AAC.1